MFLIDTHAHLDEQSIEAEIDDVIQRAQAAAVKGIVTIGTTVDSCRRAIALAEKYPSVRAAVGIHPNYVSQAAFEDWGLVCAMAKHPRVVALGETGLDQYWDHSPIELQVEYFERHLELSRETGKPFIVHCREAEPATLMVLERAALSGPLNGIMHSFCGSPETAARCIELGMLLSFSGMLTYKKNEALRQLAATVPRDRLLVETDCPYLAPTPHRGKRNEPAFVRNTAQVLAEACGLTLPEMAELTTANAKRVFRWGDEA
jgi:TatD DNase family protein